MIIHKIIVGSTVRLKCSGPKMIVYKINDDIYYCSWFNIKNNYKTGEFLLVELELA